MPRREDPGTKPQTKLAKARMAAKVTQAEMVEATGMSRSAYWRLERGRTKNPPLRHLTNCALVLGVPVKRLIEDEWTTNWLRLGPRAPTRPTTVQAILERRAARDRTYWADRRGSK